jgi:hypothetical protein
MHAWLRAQSRVIVVVVVIHGGEFPLERQIFAVDCAAASIFLL